MAVVEGFIAAAARAQGAAVEFLVVGYHQLRKRIVPAQHDVAALLAFLLKADLGVADRRNGAKPGSA